MELRPVGSNIMIFALYILPLLMRHMYFIFLCVYIQC